LCGRATDLRRILRHQFSRPEILDQPDERLQQPLHRGHRHGGLLPFPPRAEPHQQRHRPR
jgi:hypothetical protein